MSLFVRARYYDPVTARFTQEDTYRGDVMDVRSLNLYAYCYNDPVNFVDPSGHDAREVINVETKASDNGKWVTVTTTTASGTKYTTTVSSTDYNGGGIIFNGSGKSHTTGLNIGDVVMGGSIIGNTSNGSGGILSDVSNFMSLNSTAQDNVYTAYISYQNGDISISNYVESVQQNGGSLAYISPTSADAVKLTETGENRRLQEIAQALDKGLQSSEAYEGFLLLQQINGWSDDDIVASAEMFGVGIGGGGKGQVIFMTHGLRSDAQAFQTTVRNLKDMAPGKYISLGIVTAGRGSNNGQYYTGSDQAGIYLNDDARAKLEELCGPGAGMTPENMAKVIDYYTNQGYHVIIRTEFSNGVRSFEQQLTEFGGMVNRFGGFNADVTFVGHSMGGLASINYGMRYASNNTNKQINIITVDTPYHENAWAAADWNTAVGDKNHDAATGANGPVGRAQRDLGGVGSTAMKDLQNKWNNYTGRNITLYAINVSMYDPAQEKNWSDKGDGVVDIPSQRGGGWNRVNVQPTIEGTGQGHWTPAGDLMNTDHLYHHVNTPNRLTVARQINNLIN